MSKSFILLATLLLCSCAVHNSQEYSEIQLYLKNKKVVDNSNLEIVIKNNSKEDYYLLLNTTSLQDFLKEFNDATSLFTLSDGIEDSHGIGINKVVTSDGAGEYKTHLFKDIFKINSGQEKTLSIPFNMKLCLSEDYCLFYDSKMMDFQEKYYAYVKYNVNMPYFKNALPKNIKDSLEIMGYKMFDKTIKSNRVELEYKLE